MDDGLDGGRELLLELLDLLDLNFDVDKDLRDCDDFELLDFERLEPCELGLREGPCDFREFCEPLLERRIPAGALVPFETLEEDLEDLEDLRVLGLEL